MTGYTGSMIAYQPADWWQAALSSRVSVVCVAVLLLGGAALLLLARAAHRLHPVRSLDPVALTTDQRGTATIEFAMVFPVLLFLSLVLAQTTMLMGGNMFVHYAAFAATRTAIVQIPFDYSQTSGELPNVYLDAPGSAKHDAIYRSAVFALAPVSGRSSGDAQVAADEYVAGLSSFYSAYGRTQPNWVSRLAADQLRYAALHTEAHVVITTVDDDQQVSFSPINGGEPYAFGPRDPITVRITHKLNLAVPYVGMLFADGRNSDETDNRRYALVEAQYTLTNEGASDALPPLPDLPRIP